MPTKALLTARFRFNLHPALRAAVDELAERNGCLMSEEVRRAIASHLADPLPSGEDTRFPVLPPVGGETTIVMRPTMRVALDELAEHTGRGLAGEIRVAIERHLRANDIRIEADPDLLSVSA